MVNFNGKFYASDAYFLHHSNRGLRYGDALFETIRVVNGQPWFWEDHYFRLMSSMRILRMEIPMDFTMEFLERQMCDTLEACQLAQKPARIRLTLFRSGKGLYTPETNAISYLIEAVEINSPFYSFGEGSYKVDLFKDFYVNGRYAFHPEVHQ